MRALLCVLLLLLLPTVGAEGVHGVVVGHDGNGGTISLTSAKNLTITAFPTDEELTDALLPGGNLITLYGSSPYLLLTFDNVSMERPTVACNVKYIFVRPIMVELYASASPMSSPEEGTLIGKFSSKMGWHFVNMPDEFVHNNTTYLALVSHGEGACKIDELAIVSRREAAELSGTYLLDLSKLTIGKEEVSSTWLVLGAIVSVGFAAIFERRPRRLATAGAVAFALPLFLQFVGIEAFFLSYVVGGVGGMLCSYAIYGALMGYVYHLR